MAAEIRKLMDEKRLFLQPNLKINDLAMMLNTNRNYIYNAINGEIGFSFSDYINQKRIEHAINLIDHNPNMLLTDVATKSGFSSASSFYRNFKTITGCSPSDYQKKQDANNHCQHPA
jgi:AraC-like DNA-binding protein